MRIKTFFKQPTTPGIVLIISGLLAMIVSNSQWSNEYASFLYNQQAISPIFIVNDLLMTIFFLAVGLEIKEQITNGHLSRVRQIILPALAACGGVILPALIYLVFNYQDPLARSGWAIPTATDIAFALGVILLLGNRIPPVLHVLLLTIAIIDDLIAILIIALFYSKQLSMHYLMLSVLCFLVMYWLKAKNNHKYRYYLCLGSIMWLCVFKTGVHPAISGAFVAFAMPHSMRVQLHHFLLPWVNFLILPAFALANAGVTINNFGSHLLLDPVTLGITLGLLLGKQIGIFSCAWIGIKMKIASLPREVSLVNFYGMSMLCGIGFTMSVFIANLAFAGTNTEYAMMSKVGILIGSCISAILGYAFLRYKN